MKNLCKGEIFIFNLSLIHMPWATTHTKHSSITRTNKNAFQQDAHRRLVDHIPACIAGGYLPGGIPAQGGYLPGGLPAQGVGVYLLGCVPAQGACTFPWGVYVPGWVYVPGGYLPRGTCQGGEPTQGVYLPGGTCPGT